MTGPKQMANLAITTNFGTEKWRVDRIINLPIEKGSKMLANLAKMANLANVAILMKFCPKVLKNLSTEYIKLPRRVPECWRIILRFLRRTLFVSDISLVWFKVHFRYGWPKIFKID